MVIDGMMHLEVAGERREGIFEETNENAAPSSPDDGAARACSQRRLVYRERRRLRMNEAKGSAMPPSASSPEVPGSGAAMADGANDWK